MSAGQYVATRPFPTTHRQYEIGDMIDTSRITSSELNAGVASGAIEPARFIDTAARLAAVNPVLGPGVHAYETDTGVHKIGTDGVTRYNDLDQVGDGTYAARGFSGGSTAYEVRAVGDGLTGQRDAKHNGDSGYIDHLRTGPNTTANCFLIAMGTDEGLGGGLLVSHKNGGGAGISVTANPGSSFGLYLKNYNKNTQVLWVDQYVQSASSIRLQYKTGAAFSTGSITAGSTTITSSDAAFVAGDVGQALTQVKFLPSSPQGAIPAGTTITAVTSGTTATMSQAATVTATGVGFLVAGRVPGTGQTILDVMDTDGTTELLGIRRTGVACRMQMYVAPNTTMTAKVALQVQAPAGQTADAFQIMDSAATVHIRATKATAAVPSSFVVGSAALATNATDGFIYAPTCAGTPTGTPTTQTGTVPILIDTTGSRLWAYVGGAWKSAALA